MKKILLIIGMLLVEAVAFAGKYEDGLKERMKVAEERLESKFEGTTADMLNASSELTDEWEKEMNKVYDLILKKLSAKEQSKFKTEQTKWLNDRKAAIKKALADEEDGPKMAVFGAAGTEYEMTKARVLELAKKYDKLNK
ncbi:lysozyme inhibitor LprI family protein [Leptotrichia massiliensis]|uniref:lysozyme inhibitor LprI family protein n=1 Tax=Leptotrichia massiliensis TaxID=1852388 RepID=UPI0008D9F54A|nr:lysozyme inhibitor LprI family protein [Leptotrichia massiliensis]